MSINNSTYRFSIKRSQILLLMILVLNLVVLTFSTSTISRGESKDEKVFSSLQSTSISLILVQRETLAYTTRFAQWQAGIIPRRELQIARALLAQRLDTFMNENQLNSLKPSLRYFEELAVSDRIISFSKPGFLTDRDRRVVKVDSNKFLDSMLGVSRSFTDSYRLQIDKKLENSAKDRRQKAELNLYLLMSFIFFTTIFVLFSLKTFNKQYREILNSINEQLILLKNSKDDLINAESLVRNLSLVDIRKNEFISTINHELRTPLTSIIGYVDILKENIDSNTNVQNKHILSVIERNSETLLNLVEDILSLSTLESSVNYALTEVDVKSIITDCILALAPQSSASGIAIRMDVQENIETVIDANRNQIFQALSNVLSNAIKFSKSQSKVLINISEKHDKKSVRFIKISITDEGIGIPESQILEVFTNFFRASNAQSSDIPGTGLGLAITSRIIEFHKGSIKVESTMGVGSTFTIELPAHISELERMINERKYGVLERAISEIESSAHADLGETCHEMIGALGFYEFGFLSDEIALFSDWLKTDEAGDENKISSQRLKLLVELKSNLPGINSTGGVRGIN